MRSQCSTVPVSDFIWEVDNVGDGGMLRWQATMYVCAHTAVLVLPLNDGGVN